jgi:hypothetical protein
LSDQSRMGGSCVSLVCSAQVSASDIMYSAQDAFKAEPQEITMESLPSVLYQNLEYDARQPWDGFLRSSILVMVTLGLRLDVTIHLSHSKVYKKIFSTRLTHHLSGNTIAYISTLVSGKISFRTIGHVEACRSCSHLPSGEHMFRASSRYCGTYSPSTCTKIESVTVIGI